MTEDKTPGPSIASSASTAFLGTIWGRTLSMLAALTMIGGIVAEGLSIYRNWQETQIGNNKILESKAEQCSKRRRYVLDYVPMDQWVEANAKIDADCDPLYAERPLKCALKYQDLEAAPSKLASFMDRLQEFRAANCTLNDEQTKHVVAKIQELTALAIKKSAPPAAAEMKSAPPQTAPTPLSTSAPKPVSFTIFDNTDMLNGDLQTLKNVTLDDCIAACRNDSRCRAYSYDKWNSSCYPKSEIHALSLTARSIAAVREDQAEPGRATSAVTFEHFHKRAFPRQEQGKKNLAPSAPYCEKKCAAADWCVAYTFYEETSECQLLKTTAVYNPDTGAESGAKIQERR